MKKCVPEATVCALDQPDGVRSANFRVARSLLTSSQLKMTRSPRELSWGSELFAPAGDAKGSIRSGAEVSGEDRAYSVASTDTAMHNARLAVIRSERLGIFPRKQSSHHIAMKAIEP